MKILFIGGTGNISADCAALLHQRGHEIAVVSRGQSAVPPSYRAIRADRRDPAAMRSALAGLETDVVINFLGFETPELAIDWEIFRGRIRQYIFISSATVYAKPRRSFPTTGTPKPPSQPAKAITEDTPLGNPWWDYAQKKIQCEEWLRARGPEDGFPFTIVRPSHTYSRRWIPNPLSSSSYTFAARLEHGRPVFVPDDGENPWTLTAASDFAAGLAGLLGRAETMGEAFHITSDEVLTWNQIYAEIACALGVSNPEVVPVPTSFICQLAPRMAGSLDGDKAHPGVFDNSKIKRIVPEFRCVKPFRVGVRESVTWLRAHPEQQNLNPQLDALCDEVIAAWRTANPTG